VFRVGFYQFRPLFGEPDRNFRKVADRLKDLRADLVLLPELPFTGYLFRDRGELRALSEEPSRSPIVAGLAGLCRERGFRIVTGFAEKSRDKCFNSALLIGPRGVIRTYRKIHLFNLEKRWFDRGDLPFQVSRIKGVRVGMMICWDWIFPEAARMLALKGADVLAHPSNLVLEHCQRVMPSRCIENGVFSITANRFGEDRRPHGSVRFSGKSQIVGPRGEQLYMAPSQREQLYCCDIDPRAARDKMITPGNHLLKDRRPEFYGP
jgi:predicted amidohydrolase